MKLQALYQRNNNFCRRPDSRIQEIYISRVFNAKKTKNGENLKKRRKNKKFRKKRSVELLSREGK